MDYKEKVSKKLEELKHKQDIYILAIESSCDETSIAIVKNGREVLVNEIASQIDIHTRFGGVVPEVASRNHVLVIDNILKIALEKAGMQMSEIDAVAVTYGAGLMGALMVGVNFAKSLAYKFNLPLIAVNHIKGHISANYIQDKQLEPPFICLVVSGGHTAILRVDDYINHTLIGQTLDDAIGEAFDKVARVVGLGYPGGPKIDKQSKLGNNCIEFTHKSNLDKTFNISYSGIKTAVINYVHKMEQNGQQLNIPDICKSFQCQAVDMLVDKTIKAAKKFKLKKIALAGGVAANSYLRETLTTKAQKEGINVYYPAPVLCTDNGAMIGACAYYNLINGVGNADLNLTPNPSLKL